MQENDGHHTYLNQLPNRPKKAIIQSTGVAPYSRVVWQRDICLKARSPRPRGRICRSGIALRRPRGRGT